MNILNDSDISCEILRGKRIAVIGFGSQGRAQALNLRDGGYAPIVGLRNGGASPSPRWREPLAAGLDVRPIAEAAAAADIVLMLIPDEVQPEVYTREIAPHLRPGAYVGFAHGFAVHYGALVPAADTNIFMVAPKGIGPMLRQKYEVGSGVPALIAVHQDPSGDTRAVALAYAAALGCGRIGIMETTFREETETDLFSEQAVLCGGLTALIKAGFETLVEAGYAPEVAYFECLHEVKLIADLIHARGIAGMRALISNTAKFGDLTRGPRVIGSGVRQAMRALLGEVQSGQFAREWLAEYAAGKPHLNELAARDAEHLLESVGARVRALWDKQPTGSSGQ